MMISLIKGNKLSKPVWPLSEKLNAPSDLRVTNTHKKNTKYLFTALVLTDVVS